MSAWSSTATASILTKLNGGKQQDSEQQQKMMTSPIMSSSSTSSSAPAIISFEIAPTKKQKEERDKFLIANTNQRESDEEDLADADLRAAERRETGGHKQSKGQRAIPKRYKLRHSY